MTIQIKNKAIPSSPRSKNYPTGAIVSVSSGGGSGVTSNASGSNVTILGKDDLRSATDLNVFSSLRTLAEILSIIVTKDDAETKLTDSNVLSSLRVNKELDTINERFKDAIDALKDSYLSKTAPDETQFLIKLLGGLIVDNGLDVTKGISTDTLTATTVTTQILNVLDKLIAKSATFSDNVTVSKKTTTLNLLVQELAETHDLSVSHVATLMGTIVKDYISSESFVSGFGGEGMKIYKAITGDWNMEIDNLTVRKIFSIFELVVQKITYQGGMIIRSAAGGKLTKVTDGGSHWRCEHDSTDDFVQDDQIICQAFTGTATRRYWRLVTSAGTGYFNLSKVDCEEGSGIPETGDNVAVLGNRTNTARQKAQIDCAVGDSAPYRDDYDGINSYSLVNRLITRTGNLNGITDAVFGVLTGSGLYGTNVYLKGTFVLHSGKKIEEAIDDVKNDLNERITDVETNFEIREGQISSKIKEVNIAVSNAKQSETNASGSASFASSSATTAGVSANNAAKSATDAQGAATNAGKILEEVTLKESSITQTAGEISTKVTEVNKKVTEANTAATNAKNSATSASGSAGTASGKAGEAANSAANAKQSADNAAKVLEDVTLKESSITQTAGNITLQVTEVTKNVVEANTAATTALTKASEASTSAGTASTKAGEASASATNAKNSASTASIKAGEASTSATNAKNSADSAAAKLTTISQKESSINQTASSITLQVKEVTTKANEAANSATTAATKAGEAASSATNAAKSATDAKALLDNVDGKYVAKTVYDSEIKVLSDSINLKVEKTDFNALGSRVSAAEASISTQAGQIALKASQSSVNDLTGRMSTAESSITQNAQQISLKVTSTEAGNIADGKVNALKSDLQATGIDIANRKVTVTADTFRIQDNYGNAIAVFKTNTAGKPILRAENIDVDNLTAKKLDGATGTFKKLQGIDDNNKIKCAIGFSSDEGKMYFEGDMQHQGIFNDPIEGNRSYRFYTADLWCRGQFGHQQMTSLSFSSNSTCDFFAHIYNYGTDTFYHKYGKAGQPIDCIFLEGSGNNVAYICDSPRRKMVTVVNNSNYVKRVMVTYQSSNTVTIQPWNFLIFITADTYTLNNPARVVNLHVMQ
ncbi:hypothetical protein HMPREF3015_22615 [Bacteroides sp. HMSC073E02]|uniref:hypothetical protein n=1 Tax=Bacteroides sp. HMSC073E02 TaxID=1739517 RepID=UPI0008A22BA0|nr:hypothetical protein [Bacteroides sp. HMSC073E02]OFO82123.1 hypothetical protein HMPREF3015_22615 [Bacteroides sp. HMSC073E02]